MTMRLKQQALYDSAVQSLKALGLTAGDFCVLTLATDICQMTADTEFVDLEAVIEVFCGDNMAYETLEAQVQSAWRLIE